MEVYIAQKLQDALEMLTDWEVKDTLLITVMWDKTLLRAFE